MMIGHQKEYRACIIYIFLVKHVKKSTAIISHCSLCIDGGKTINTTYQMAMCNDLKTGLSSIFCYNFEHYLSKCSLRLWENRSKQSLKYSLPIHFWVSCLACGIFFIVVTRRLIESISLNHKRHYCLIAHLVQRFITILVSFTLFQIHFSTFDRFRITFLHPANPCTSTIVNTAVNTLKVIYSDFPDMGMFHKYLTFILIPYRLLLQCFH